jgi:hypothetical protein
LDTQIIGDHAAADLTKEIRSIEPHQKILMTSTCLPNQLSNVMENAGLDKNQILQKPFHLSRLLKAITETAN